jgi:hypothetical protein
MRYPTSCPVCLGDLYGDATSTWATCAVCDRSFDTLDLTQPLVAELAPRGPRPPLSRSSKPPVAQAAQDTRSEP